MRQDRRFGIVLLVVCGLLFVETLYFPTRLYIPLGVAFWPRLLLGLLAVLGAILVVRGSLDDGPFDTIHPKALMAALAGFAYIGLLEIVGYLILTPIFLFAGSCVLAWSLERRQILTASTVAILGTAVTYVIFHYGLLVQLPEGLLD